ncbi:MAG TPA: hypothetical protein VH370_21305 [Humisphaera sp.]|jgi:hypothetical protein|nr:hypothetical protein [Humisphaera sp.]
MKRIVRSVAIFARTLSLIAAFGVLGWAARSYICDDSIRSVRRYVVGRDDVTLYISANTRNGVFVVTMDRQARVWDSEESARQYLQAVRRVGNPPLKTFEWEATGIYRPEWELPAFYCTVDSVVMRNVEPGSALPIDVHHRELRVPFWPLAILLAVPWAVGVIRGRRRRRRFRIGHCAKCGYDMRATPKRCPECGTPTANAK